MASPTSPVQESLTIKSLDYYDIMIIGHTGQGKSTTSDKLLIANPTHKTYTCDGDVTTDGKKLVFDDLSLWATDQKNVDNIESRLKSLAFARTQGEPQMKINQIRDAEGSSKTRTTSCELFSNDTTKVRVLDVPGFYDEEALSKGGSEPNTFNKELSIMRDIINIQTSMNLNFKKILYFLPGRGVLERAGAVVQTEMKILMYYFGKQVIEKLVIIATNQKRWSLKPGGDEFPNEDGAETISNFNRCLEILNVYEDVARIPQIPLICISLSETCESILEKVQNAAVTGPDIKLEFDPHVCKSCGKKVGFINGKKMVCYIDDTDVVPYEESSCHPMFIYDYRWYERLVETLARVLSLGFVRSLAETLSVREVCVKCKAVPGSPACLQVMKEFKHNEKMISCDHTCS